MGGVCTLDQLNYKYIIEVRNLLQDVLVELNHLTSCRRTRTLFYTMSAILEVFCILDSKI